ncbi:MAG: hypothetical protein EBS05_27220 [Proteobacteria bacterium]|nr:hypothetical protein [Pseudomonadota bacterium]
MKKRPVQAQVSKEASLKKRAVSIQQQPSNPMRANVGLTPKELRWIRRIQDALSFDLLSKPLKKCVTPEMHYVRGHCSVATEAAYHLFAKEAGFKPYSVKCADGGTHWWLVHPERKVVLDVTEPQIAAGFDYSRRRQYFQNPSPSSRAVVLMIRVLLLPERENSKFKRNLLRDLQKASQ